MRKHRVWIIGIAAVLALAGTAAAMEMGVASLAKRAKESDPVSGKKVKAKDASIAIYLDTIYKFESAENLAKFRATPEKYAVVDCPVSKDPVRVRDAKAKSEHGGRTWYFCSDDCKAKFDSDPAKYETYLCLACGMSSLVGDSYTVSGTIEGRTLHFCCPDCKKRVAKDAALYLALIVPEGGEKTPAGSGPAAKPTESNHDHEGHSH